MLSAVLVPSAWIGACRRDPVVEQAIELCLVGQAFQQLQIGDLIYTGLRPLDLVVGESGCPKRSLAKVTIVGFRLPKMQRLP